MGPSDDAPGRPGSDEAELVRRARVGDAEAERALFERHAPRMRAVVRRRLRGILRRRVGESDVVQEAWLTAHLRWADFEDRGEGSFGRWLGQILEHKVRDEIRRQLGTSKRDARLERSQARGEAPPEPAARDASPSHVVMRREGRERVERALDALPEGQRLVIRMAHLEGLPLAEVARRLGKTPDAVYKAYGRAVEALAERLGEADVD